MTILKKRLTYFNYNCNIVFRIITEHLTDKGLRFIFIVEIKTNVNFKFNCYPL